MTSLTNEQAFAELYYSKKAIKDVLGVTVQCWRPPYGDVDDRIRYIAQSLGMRTIIWSDNTFDYDVSTLGTAKVQAYYDTILQGGQNGTYAKNGTIVLTHELTNDTMSLMVKNYANIKKAFANVVPVHAAMNNTQPYVETGYTYPVRCQAPPSPPYFCVSFMLTSPLALRTLRSTRRARPRSRSRRRPPCRRTPASRSRCRLAQAGRSRLRSRTPPPAVSRPLRPPRPLRPLPVTRLRARSDSLTAR